MHALQIFGWLCYFNYGLLNKTGKGEINKQTLKDIRHRNVSINLLWHLKRENQQVTHMISCFQKLSYISGCNDNHIDKDYEAS